MFEKNNKKVKKKIKIVLTEQIKYDILIIVKGKRQNHLTRDKTSFLLHYSFFWLVKKRKWFLSNERSKKREVVFNLLEWSYLDGKGIIYQGCFVKIEIDIVCVVALRESFLTLSIVILFTSTSRRKEQESV